MTALRGTSLGGIESEIKWFQHQTNQALLERDERQRERYRDMERIQRQLAHLMQNPDGSVFDSIAFNHIVALSRYLDRFFKAIAPYLYLDHGKPQHNHTRNRYYLAQVDRVAT